jgi:hypothetical protein
VKARTVGTLAATAEDVPFDCPFCPGHFYVGDELRAVAGVVPDGLILHSLPPCVEFIALDCIEYLATARKALGLVMPWDSVPS